jgi:hypothetical protein
MKLFGSMNSNTAPAYSGRRLPGIEEGSNSVSSLSLNSGAMVNQRQNKVSHNVSSKNRRDNLIQLIHPAIEKKIIQIIKKKQSEIVDHDENIIRLETLKNENKIILEKAAISKNKAILKNEDLINTKKNEIAVLEKAIKSNAAILYSQVLRIKRENKNLIAPRTMAGHLKIKNGKYLLFPLIKSGQFRSFGAQLAYQARRIAGQREELPAPASGAEKQANQWSLYERVEI